MKKEFLDHLYLLRNGILRELENQKVKSTAPMYKGATNREDELAEQIRDMEKEAAENILIATDKTIELYLKLHK